MIKQARKAIYTPVLIVGGGPVGLTLSLLLSKYGIRSRVLEKDTRLTDHPRAHFINTRTMEIYRSLASLNQFIAMCDHLMNGVNSYIALPSSVKEMMSILEKQTTFRPHTFGSTLVFSIRRTAYTLN